MPAIDWKYPEFKGVKSYWDTEKKRYVRSKKYQDFLQEKEKIKRKEILIYTYVYFIL